VGRAQTAALHSKKTRVKEIPLPLVFRMCAEGFLYHKKKSHPYITG
jgi:hypothetical protein